MRIWCEGRGGERGTRIRKCMDPSRDFPIHHASTPPSPPPIPPSSRIFLQSHTFFPGVPWVLCATRTMQAWCRGRGGETGILKSRHTGCDLPPPGIQSTLTPKIPTSLLPLQSTLTPPHSTLTPPKIPTLAHTIPPGGPWARCAEVHRQGGPRGMPLLCPDPASHSSGCWNEWGEPFLWCDQKV